MGNLNRKRSRALVALAAVFLLRPSPAFADDANGLPTPPAVNNGVEGNIDDVTINGMTFKQGRQVVSSSAADSVSVDVEIYAPDGVGSRLNSQRHTTIQYRWNMAPNADGDGKELTETITVKSTVENRDTGKTTTERDDNYKLKTEWVRAGMTYALSLCNARSHWGNDWSSGDFTKGIIYINGRAADGNSFVWRQPIYVVTDYEIVDPFLDPFSEKWFFTRRTTWAIDLDTGKATVQRHGVNINGAEQQDPFGLSMIEMALTAGGMTPLISDPSIPALSAVPLEWPARPPM